MKRPGKGKDYDLAEIISGSTKERSWSLWSLCVLHTLLVPVKQII